MSLLKNVFFIRIESWIEILRRMAEFAPPPQIQVEFLFLFYRITEIAAFDIYYITVILEV